MSTTVALASIVGTVVAIYSVVLLTRQQIREATRARGEEIEKQIVARVAPVEKDLKEMTDDRNYWRDLARKRGVEG